MKNISIVNNSKLLGKRIKYILTLVILKIFIIAIIQSRYLRKIFISYVQYLLILNNIL